MITKIQNFTIGSWFNIL